MPLLPRRWMTVSVNPGASTAAIVLGEIYRHGATWDCRAIGKGWTNEQTIRKERLCAVAIGYSNSRPPGDHSDGHRFRSRAKRIETEVLLHLLPQELSACP
ncbi:TerD family protein [Streptomyces sp. NPDC048252]|uniref:TerD family protein n=1 Tax=Streptomyces sp. NPDC048252 TaxID=3154612 RepID=UPI00342EEEA5